MLRVLFCCSGTGRANRGIESFFREAFDGLKHTKGLELRLLKGDGCETVDERVVWSIARNSRLAKALGGMLRRDGYAFEQWSSFPSVVWHIREFRPDVVFYSEANLGFLLFRFRKWIGVPYRLLFSNGGPVGPPFNRTDFVHQVAPTHLTGALEAGESVEKQFFVPYGIGLVKPPTLPSAAERATLRRKLGLPLERKIVLSVGWISKAHKRMDYVIKEIAKLPYPGPYLQLLGAMDESSEEIVALGKSLLGSDSFAARSVPYEEVFEYYRAADCFVLGSLKEGFGRVYLEALMHGLPVIAHQNPVTSYVLGTYGLLGDLTRSGVLATLLARELSKRPDPALMRRRWVEVRDRFSWPVLAHRYLEMFQLSAVKNGRDPGLASYKIAEPTNEKSNDCCQNYG